MKIIIEQYEILIDDEDFDKISKIKWRINKFPRSKVMYARATFKYGGVYMHRIIMEAKNNQKIDHINGNGLDNRKINLRFATHQENNYNKIPYSNNKCGYKGVRFVSNGSKHWIATITHNGITQYIGSYYNLEDAAIAYDQKAKKLFGEFAYLNFPERNKL